MEDWVHLMDDWVHLINRLAAGWWHYCVSMTWQFVVVVVLVATLSILLRRVAAACHYGLWLLVLIKLIMLPSTSAVTGLGYWFRSVPAAPEVQVEAREIILRGPDAPGPPASLKGKGAIQPISVPSVVTWQARLLLVWLAVVMAFLVLMRRTGKHLARGISAAGEVTRPELLALWRECLAKMKVTRRIKLMETAHIASPVVMGCFRPAVVLPAGMDGPKEVLEPILLHELAHIRRWDYLVNWGQVCLQIWYWYNPLVWWANARIRRLRERVCDDLVLACLGDRPEQYARSLVEMAKRYARAPHPEAGLIAMAGPEGDIAQRVRRILDRRRKIVPTMSRSMVLGLVLVGLVILPWGTRKPAMARMVAPARAANPAAERPISDARGVIPGNEAADAMPAFSGGGAPWENYSADFNKGPGTYNIWYPGVGRYIYSGGLEKVFGAWPQTSSKGTGDSRFGYVLFGAPSTGVRIGDPGYALPFHFEARVDLPEGASAGIDVSPLAIDIESRSLVRYRYFDAGGRIVNDDIWTNLPATGPVTFSALGCPSAICAADPVSIRYTFTAEDPPRVVLAAATDSGAAWSSAPQPLIWSPWKSVRFDVLAYGKGYPEGIPTAPGAVDVKEAPPIRVSYIKVGPN